MARRIPEENLLPILKAVQAHPDGATASQISAVLKPPPPRGAPFNTGFGRLWTPSVSSWKARAAGRVTASRGTSAFGFKLPPGVPSREFSSQTVVPALTGPGIEIRDHVRQPREARTPPSATTGSFLIHTIRTRLSISRRTSGLISARPDARWPMNNLRETHAMKVLNRLLIDLSWNSSRLEGNTYSLLDTRAPDRARRGGGREGPPRGADDSQSQGRNRVSGHLPPRTLASNRYTILNLHALLADNLLPDPAATGPASPESPSASAFGLSSPRSATTHRGVLRPGTCHGFSHRRPLRAGAFRDGAPPVSPAI